MKTFCVDCVCWVREGRPGTGVCHYSPLNNPVKGEGDWCVQGFTPLVPVAVVAPPSGVVFGQFVPEGKPPLCVPPEAFMGKAISDVKPGEMIKVELPAKRRRLRKKK